MESKQYPVFCRLYMRFDNAKSIYPSDWNKKKVTCSLEDILKIETDVSRWVQIPDDFLSTDLMDVERKWLAEMISLDKESTLEIGVEFYDQNLKEWPSISSSTNCSLDHLKVGDIVDVMDDQGKWYESVIRNIRSCPVHPQNDHIFVHYIGWNQKWDELVPIRNNSDRDRVAVRGTNTDGPFRVISKSAREQVSRPQVNNAQTRDTDDDDEDEDSE